MGDMKRASSLSSLASSRKKQSKEDSHELIKGKLVRKTSSISSSSTPKKGKQRVSSLKEDDHNEAIKAKVLTRRASSLSSPSTPTKKGKQSLSSMKDNHDDMVKGKSARRISSFSSFPTKTDNSHNSNELHKEKPVRKASLLSSSSSSSIHSSTKKEKNSMSSINNPERSRKSSSLIKSKIKELGPICKMRKEVLNSMLDEDNIDVYLDKQIEGEGKVNSNDCLWLSSGSMSPQEFGLFMSALDPCLDEFVLSFLPRSRTPNAVNGSKAKSPVIEANVSGKLEEEEEAVDEVNESTVAHSQSIDSSSFWNMDRTGVWVSLINLNEEEESKLISEVDSKLDDLESNFPSPSFAVNWDSCSSDVGISSSTISTTQESGSQSEWSSDLLSDSLDWELESNDPIFWPFGVDYDWESKEDVFSVSPRKGVYKIRFESRENGSSSDSIRFRLHGKNGKRILFMSGLSASKIIEFKKGYRKNNSSKGKRSSKIGKRGSRYKRRVVPPILENDLEGLSPKDTPKESLKKGNSNNNNHNSSSDVDLLSECTDNWGDEMDSNSPLFWPTDDKTDWNLTWDSFQVSPRKSTQSNTNLGSPKNGFAVSSSVRLKFLPKSKTVSSKTGLSASKSFKFKSSYQKTNAISKRSVVVFPRKRRSMFKPNHGKKKREMPLKVGNKSVHELIRLVSFIGMNKMFPGNEVTSSEGVPIETIVGLDAFDGHEGFDMEFEGADFSLMECA